MSGEIVMCNSGTSAVFQWILHLLCGVLPCRGLIRTVCSDDDVCLQAAFDHYGSLAESDELARKVSALSRVICFRHKMQNFMKFLNANEKNKGARDEMITLFQVIGKARDRHLYLSVLHMLEGYQGQGISGRTRWAIKHQVSLRLLIADSSLA